MTVARIARSLVVAVVLAGAAPVRAAGDPWHEPARYRFDYRVELPGVAVPEGKRLRVWVPYPATTADQQVQSAEIVGPWAHQLTTDAFGNRTVYLEGTSAAPAPLLMRFVVERAPSSGVPASAVAPDTPLDPRRYTRPARLIPLDGVIRQIAEAESRGLDGDDEKARAFYRYVVRTMRYDKDGTGWGRGDAVWACTNQRGNCTDFHSLLIGMALSQGIPARFLIGFPIPADAERGEIPGYHCWAEYYSTRHGWVPIDSSEAKKSGRVDDYFGRLPNDRILFTTGRDLHLEPPQDGPPLNYFVYPYAELDGEPVPTLRARFRFERLPGAVAQR